MHNLHFPSDSLLNSLPLSRDGIISVAKGTCQGVRDNRFNKESFTLPIEYYIDIAYTVAFNLEENTWYRV